MRKITESILHAATIIALVGGIHAANLHAHDLDRRLIRRLTGKSETVRQQALVEIQQYPRRKYELLPELIQAANEIDRDISRQSLKKRGPDKKTHVNSSLEQMPPISTVGLIYLIGSIERAESVQCLIGLLKSQHAGMVMIVADALGKNKCLAAIEPISQLKSHPTFDQSYGFRFNLIRALAQMEHPEAIEKLTLWRSDFDGQLSHEIDQLLAKVTETDFRGDTDRFAKWQLAMKEEVAGPDANENLGNREAGKIKLLPASHSSHSLDRLKLGRKRQYYGMELNSKRMMFIIDHSGSMREYSQGMTRLQRAKVELTRVIQDLDPDTEFAIVFYETLVRRWRDSLVRADEVNKRDAVAFIKRLKFGDRTNTYGALRESIDFSYDLEAVYLLTDGRPTEGEIVAPPAIVRDILHRNRFRHLNFNTIGVAVAGPTEAFLRTLSNESGGEFRSLD